jgi:hypothetical protein
MKNLFKNTLLFLSTFCFCISVNGQTIRRVNNNPGITGVNVYTTIQAAHDAAVAGDIVYVEPSTASYGDLISTKELSIIGNGYYIFENSSSNMPQDQRSSLFGTITLNLGSANSKISGLTGSTINIKSNNVLIERCNLLFVNLTYIQSSGVVTSVGDNAVIRGCFFDQLGSASGYQARIIGTSVPTLPSGSRYITNATITNNIHTTRFRFVSSIQNSLIKNNTVNTGLSAVSNDPNEGVTVNCTFSDNVVMELSNSTVINSKNIANTYSNNILLCSTCTGNHFPVGNGNQNNVATNTYFPASSFILDKNVVQLSNSPGLTAGSLGSEVGAFGGLTPYKLAGLSSVPIITNVITSGVGNTSTPLSVSVTVRGNN